MVQLKRKAQFFIITTVLVAGGLIAITDTLSSAAVVEYDTVLRQHDTAVMANTGDHIRSSWWNSSWTLRRTVTIEERSGTYLTNETIPLVLDAEGGVNDDCSDLRVIQDGREMPWVNTTPCTVSTGEDNALARYLMEQGTGQWLNDSANNNHGQLGGDTTEQGTDPAWVTGHTGTGLFFDGIDDYVNIPDRSSLTFDDQFTLTAWIRPETIGNDQQWVVEQAQDVFMANLTSTGTLVFRLRTGTTTDLETGQTISAGEWTHVALVYNTTHMQAFFDGEQASITPKTGTLPDPNGFYLGGDATNNEDYFHGVLDEVRIFNTSLTPARINGQALGGIGLNISTTLSPQETDSLHIYFGNDFARNHSFTYTPDNLTHTLLTQRPRIQSIGPIRSHPELMKKAEQTISRFDDHTGAQLTFDHGFGCDRLTLRSPDTVLEQDIC